jgi:nitrogen-specific signal transduction histidine kinase/outer membrane protein assembly factor BamB
MKKRVSISTFLILFLIVKGESLPFELKEEKRFTAKEIIPLNIKQDKIDELLIISENHMLLSDQKERFFWDYYFGTKLPKSVSVNDFNQDGLKEIFINYSEGLTQIIECYRPTQAKDLIKRLITVKGTDRNQDGKWDGGVSVAGGIDANDDGKIDLLLKVGCSFDLQPRGVAAYDVEDGKEIWHYWFGPSVNNILIEDLDDDNKPEIIIGTYSPGNGSEANNISDMESHLIVLNQKGQLVWQKKIGDVFSSSIFLVADIDNDRKKELIIEESSRKGDKEKPDKILILDGATGLEERHIATGENFQGLVLVDLFRNGKIEIVAGNSDGKIRVFNSNLEVIKSYEYNNGIAVMAAIDLNGDGRHEIITNTDDNKLIIFDEKLKKIAEMKLEKRLSYGKFGENFGMIKPVRYHRNIKLLITIPKGHESDFVLSSFVPKTFSARQGFLSVNPFLFFALFIILLLHFFVFRRYIDLPERIAKRFYSRIKKTGYAIVNNKGKVLVANEKAEDLLGIMNLEGSNLFERIKEKKYDDLIKKLNNLKQREEIQAVINTKEGEKVISLNVYEMPKRGTYSLRIEDISYYNHLEKLQNWVPVAQKLAHGVKTPLMNIQLTAQQLSNCHDPNDEKCVKLLANVNDEVKRLRKLTDGFIRFTQLTPVNFHLENINTVIKDLIDRYLISIPPGVNFKFEFDEKIPKLALDRKEIENAFSIFIDNAIEAIGKHGTLTITTTFLQKFEEKIKDWVRIEITDTGTGIPEKYINEVFKPYFVYNKPEGTGLGLTIAKQIIENHNGNIELNSIEGAGTSIIIQLPIA